MGFQNISVNNGYQFFTVTFEDIKGETTFNISDIKCLKSDGTEWLRTGAATKACNGAVYLRKIDSKGGYGTKYIYYGKNASDTFGPGWYAGDRADDGSNLVTGESVTLKAGEGVIVYSTKSDGAVVFNVAGSVKLTPFSGSIISGYQFGGNCTPVTLNLSEVQCVKADGTGWLRTGAATKACNGAIYLRKIDAKGGYGPKYTYYGKNASDTFGPGWYNGDRADDGSNLIAGDSVTFAPGEGWIMYSTKSDNAGKVIIPSAIK